MGLMVVSCSLVGDWTDELNQRAYGLLRAAVNGNVQKAQETLNAHGKDISKKDFERINQMVVVQEVAATNDKNYSDKLTKIRALIDQKMHELGMQ